MIPTAWIVISHDGFKAVFLELVRAEQYAACCHGTVHALYLEHVIA